MKMVYQIYFWLCSEYWRQHRSPSKTKQQVWTVLKKTDSWLTQRKRTKYEKFIAKASTYEECIEIQRNIRRWKRSRSYDHATWTRRSCNAIEDHVKARKAEERKRGRNADFGETARIATYCNADTRIAIVRIAKVHTGTKRKATVLIGTAHRGTERTAKQRSARYWEEP